MLQKPGSQIVVYGSMKLQSDLPKKCFVEVFKKGEGQKVDYFSCQDCGFKCKWVYAQQRLRSAWASTQSDQSLRCPHEESLGP